jgi:hypothetical protein
MRHPCIAFLFSIVAVLISACATYPAGEDTESHSSGPTVYGQLGVSVDHVSKD